MEAYFHVPSRILYSHIFDFENHDFDLEKMWYECCILYDKVVRALNRISMITSRKEISGPHFFFGQKFEVLFVVGGAHPEGELQSDPEGHHRGLLSQHTAR